jgi:hypothetical protein
MAPVPGQAGADDAEMTAIEASPAPLAGRADPGRQPFRGARSNHSEVRACLVGGGELTPAVLAEFHEILERGKSTTCRPLRSSLPRLTL